MKNTLILSLLASCAAFATPLYISSYANGIYLVEFDSKLGKLSEPKLTIDCEAPSFLALNPTKSAIHCVAKKNEILSFSIGKDHSLTLLGTASSNGNEPCHLALDHTGMSLAFANYGGGSFGTLSLDESGKPLKIISYEQMSGTGPNTIRQEAPHAHGVYFDQSNQHLFIPDLGIDKVLVRKFDPKNGQLSPAQDLSLVPGSGPRHMAFSPDEKNAYVINELKNTVTVVKYDKASAALTAIQEISTLPDETIKGSSTAEIEVHPNGKFVYGSNRGHDSIVVFQRNETDGTLQLVQHAPCGGKTPRHFKIHSSGKWLLCAHQNSDSISVLNLDPESGKLGEPGSTVSVPMPNCILFR